MKVTIVQSEIHAAIAAYVRSLIDVKEGSRIDITLRATRGEDGTTADIDIVPDDGSGDRPAVSNKAPSPAPVSSTSSTAVKTENANTQTTPPKAQAPKAAAPKPKPAAETKPSTEEQIAQVKEEAQANGNDEVSPADQMSEEEAAARAADATDLNAPAEAEEAQGKEAEAATEEAPAGAVEEAPRKSLFAGLNSKPE